jgi:hypothetical protein
MHINEIISGTADSRLEFHYKRQSQTFQIKAMIQRRVAPTDDMPVVHGLEGMLFYLFIFMNDFHLH